MTSRIGPKGHVVIPKKLRTELGLAPGDEVIVSREGDHVSVRSAALPPPLRGRFRGSMLTEALMAERAADNASGAGS